MSDDHVVRMAGEVNVEEDLVILEGANGLAVTMTLEAAEETGRRLIAAVARARRQD